jgi:serine/threonine protein kinase
MADLPRAFGRFKVICEIGRGLFGVTYLAQGDGDRCAIKWLRSDAPEEGRSHIANEAWALGRLDHPSIPHLIESGEQCGRPYVAMSLFAGASLRKRRATQPEGKAASEVRWTLAVTVNVLDAIAYSQSQGVIHRDVKDDNIVTDDPFESVGLIDFGCCVGNGQPADTAPFQHVGAWRFNPPNKLRNPSSAHLSHDVFAVGVNAYLLLTNEYPWSVRPDQNERHLEAKMHHSAPHSVQSINRVVSSEVSEFIQSLLLIDDNVRPSALQALEGARSLLSKESAANDFHECSRASRVIGVEARPSLGSGPINLLAERARG